MTPLPAALGGGELVAWRLDQAVFAHEWDSGEGAFRVGGRWNSRGARYVVYCSLDPSTAILEVAVHKKFEVLDRVPHVLTSLTVNPKAFAQIHIVKASDLANPDWLHPGVPSIGQQQFGDGLLDKYKFVVIPSVVSNHSWNLIFDRNNATGLYMRGIQERFGLDTRLHTMT